ncbi:MAG: glutaredoxin family protein [Candidatus Helarchaeota archaeon]
MKEFTTVNGKFKKHKIKIYTISTCMWCKRLKRKLNDNEITYHYLDIDLLSREDKDELRPYLRKYRSILAFPMMFVDDEFIPNQFIGEKIQELVKDA